MNETFDTTVFLTLLLSVGISTLIDFIVLYISYEILGMNYLIGTAIAFSLLPPYLIIGQVCDLFLLVSLEKTNAIKNLQSSYH